MAASTICAPDHAARLAALRAELAARGLDGAILTTADAYQNEDPPDHDRGILWLTGFTGSLAHALVLPDQALFLVDGRYTIQAAQEVNGRLWAFAHFHDQPLAMQLRDHAAGRRVGFDPMQWSVAQIEAIRAAAPQVELVATDDLFAPVWADRPAPPVAPVTVMPDAMAGRSSRDKRDWLAAELRLAGTDLWVETRPDNIAWMLNLRGGDVAMNPLVLSFAVFSADQAHWFVDPRKLSAVPEGVQTHAPDDFLPWLAGQGRRAGFDPAFTPQAVADALRQAGAVACPRPGPITLEKACKTDAELAGFAQAHLDDAVAMARFCHWLSGELPARQPDEWDVAEALARFRAASPRYLEPSFATIAATGPNAALCHYHATRDRAARLSADQIFLCDSGGQYLGGTTDVTRTMAFGPVPDTIRRIATAVLRGFIALSSARFPVGTFPHQLDALARAPLWQMGLEYDHGTGHGVGHRLLVHEHPHRLGKAANPFPLRAGNVLTIEPGYYAEDAWGIRIENQVQVVARGAGFLGFEPMTLVPIQLSLFDLDALLPGERDWLNAYHQRVRDQVLPHLEGPVADWLIAATAPV
ncbi:MAG: aminopeptidase P family protein [Paracoccus sp. (in: a-proteobacteria)]|uniref:aminopeptidase P family protein n=1 Tax=Paracoccus sp. TaxID=267 RepID=UPI00391C13F0